MAGKITGWPQLAETWAGDDRDDFEVGGRIYQKNYDCELSGNEYYPLSFWRPSMLRSLSSAFFCFALMTPSLVFGQMKPSDAHEHGSFACDESPTPGKRPANLDCALLVTKKFSLLPPGPLVWRFENFATKETAQGAGPTASVVVEAAGKVWLLALSSKGARSKGGTFVAETDLLPPSPWV